MKRKQEIWMGGAMVAMILLYMAVLSCKTTKTVTETVHEHDTLIVHKADTVKEVKVQIVRDTVRQVESHVLTINNVGDTIKEVHHYHDIMRTVIVDSTERYKAKVDSLQRLVDSKKEKTVVKVVKKPRWIEQVVLLMLCVVCIVYALRRK